VTDADDNAMLAIQLRGHAAYLDGHWQLTGSDRVWSIAAANSMRRAADALARRQGEARTASSPCGSVAK
jgi:hypothetical protein